MVNAITSTTQPDPATASVAPTRPGTQPAASSQKPPASQSKPPVTDTVHISQAAQALQESVETPQQTAKEAGAGDQQARRLLTKEAAAEKAAQ